MLRGNIEDQMVPFLGPGIVRRIFCFGGGGVEREEGGAEEESESERWRERVEELGREMERVTQWNSMN